jgi:DNA polymerase-1
MPSGSAAGSVYLIDAHSLIFQVFHAIGAMTSPAGLPVNALFGFTRDLLTLRKRRPDYLVCAFDRGERTFRHSLYTEYKAHRSPMPDDLVPQIPLIEQVLAALAVPVVGHPDYEADDLLATLAKQAAARGYDVFVCTSDKDCRQLIDDRVRLYNLRKRQEFGRAELQADWGVTPEQVVDLQTLVGDSVDNVPGVPGIGVKTAAKLLQEFGTLENLLANVDKVSGKKRQQELRDAGPTIELSRKLVRLATDVPVEFDWEGWRPREADAAKCVELFRTFGFRSLEAEFRQAGRPEAAEPDLFSGANGAGEDFPFGANAAPATAGTQGDLFADAAPDNWKAAYHLVDTKAKFAAFLKDLKKQKRFAVDLETTDLDPRRAEIVGYAITWKPGEAWYLAVRGPEGSPLLDPDATRDALRPILEDPELAKINQNIKYDLLVMRASGIELRGVAGDSMVADYLLHAGERGHNLEELARRYLQHQVIPITDLIGKKSRKQPQLRMDQVPTARVAVYSGEDADVAWRLCDLLEPQLEVPPSAELGTGSAELKTFPPSAPHSEFRVPSLRKLYDDLEIPLIEVLAELEYNGVRLDLPLLKKLSAEMADQMAAIEKEIYQLAGHEFNIGSLVQLRKVLFAELKLPPQRKTGVTGAASTDQETLEKLAELDLPGAALPRRILEHRQIAKLKGTYVDALPELVNLKTGRVHASFNQTVASTGRLSSSDPNLQNIPVRRENGQQIRQAFVPEEGWRLLTADYSQIELRLLAHFTGDAVMCQAFAEDRDIHAAVAGQIYGVAEMDVTAEMRRVAKTVNFGVLYGMSATGLALRLRIPREEAERFIDAYFARYKSVLDYQTQILEKCRRTGYVTTILGRRRRIEGVRPDSSYRSRNQPEREAINMEIQGSAADLIKMAMLNLYRRLKGEKWRSRMLLQIHDELVFESPPDELPRLREMVVREMTAPLEKALGLRVPLKVDAASGPNWLDVN